MPEIVAVSPQQLLERFLTLEIVRVTERAAVSAARLRGHGNKIAADQAAVEAMRRELGKMPIDGASDRRRRARQGADALHRQEGRQPQRAEGRHCRRSPRRHNPLRQGYAGCDRNHGDGGGRHAVERARRLHPDDLDWSWLCQSVVDLDAPPADNIRRLARAKGVRPQITALVMDRPRHADIIAAVRSTGASVRLISDGDVAGVIHTADPENSGVDIQISTGGAPEGVLVAAALRCISGQMECRLVLDTDEKRERAARMGVIDPRMIFSIDNMVKGDCLFAATGVATGALMSGVKFRRD